MIQSVTTALGIGARQRIMVQIHPPAAIGRAPLIHLGIPPLPTPPAHMSAMAESGINARWPTPAKRLTIQPIGPLWALQ